MVIFDTIIMKYKVRKVTLSMMKKIINSMLTRGGSYNTYININKVNNKTIGR